MSSTFRKLVKYLFFEKLLRLHKFSHSFVNKIFPKFMTYRIHNSFGKYSSLQQFIKILYDLTENSETVYSYTVFLHSGVYTNDKTLIGNTELDKCLFTTIFGKRYRLYKFCKFSNSFTRDAFPKCAWFFQNRFPPHKFLIFFSKKRTSRSWLCLKLAKLSKI